MSELETCMDEYDKTRVAMLTAELAWEKARAVEKKARIKLDAAREANTAAFEKCRAASDRANQAHEHLVHP